MPRFSIRAKLTLATLTPLAFILVLVALASSYLINAWIVGQAQDYVRKDLNAARTVFRHEEERIRSVVRFTSGTDALLSAVARGDAVEIARELDSVRLREDLDILTFTGTQGDLTVRAQLQSTPKGGTPPLPVASLALEGEDFTGTILISADELAREGEDLPRRARIPLYPIPPPGAETEMDQGMAIVSATPVHNRDGFLLGCLYGGVLLNGNLPLVDQIQDIVYGSETYEGIETGSATIFLGKVRVATTVRLANGLRALGTAVSQEVAESVLERRQTWVDRAKVVDNWYLTAYEPIFDHRGKTIGALYVGLLEQPFLDLKHKAAVMLLVLMLVGGLLGLGISRVIALRLSRPLLDLDAMAERVAKGDRRVALPVANNDEIGHLTETFNRMATALKGREDELHDLNRELEWKVRQRTEMLERKSLQLIQAQEELLRSEKLAAIGSLAAGVAHEINNPAAIIRGNVEILLMELDSAAEGRDEAEEILRQTERISLITQNMLAFAREQTFHPTPVDINGLLDDILAQVGHQVPMGTVTVERSFEQDLPPVQADRERLHQVFNNMIINALQAMSGEGILRVSTRVENGMAEIAVTDTGPGIAKEAKEKIFNPFFTTKKSGTGLGLSVSYGIVKAFGGTIEAENGEEVGAVFRVKLPLAG